MVSFEYIFVREWIFRCYYRQQTEQTNKICALLSIVYLVWFYTGFTTMAFTLIHSVLLFNVPKKEETKRKYEIHMPMKLTAHSFTFVIFYPLWLTNFYSLHRT